MEISLIICTRNRAVMLERCLAHVAAIAFSGAWEIVLVDNGSSDGTAQVIAAFAAGAPCPVVHVEQPIPGLSNARNAGIAAASGGLILFTDDDCYAAPELLSATRAAFADPAIGYASGRIMLHDPADYRTTINESLVPLRFPARQFLAAGEVKGANLAFRRSVLDAIGPFDPRFGSGALFPSEDADAAMRASLAGWEGAYVPEMVVHHHHGRRAADMPALLRAYDLGRGAFHAKLLGLHGGFRPGLAAWARLPWRIRARPGVARGELLGAARYWRSRPVAPRVGNIVARYGGD